MAVLLHACAFLCYLNNLKFTENCFAHIPQIVHLGGLETERIITNKCVPLRYVLVSRLLWFCGFIRLVCFVADLHCTLHAPA